jgi:hypothetical protein
MGRLGYGIAAVRKDRDVVLFQHAISTERETLVFRLLALVIATATLYFWQEDTTEIPLGPAVGVAATYLAYSLLLGRAILPWVVPRLTLGLSISHLVGAIVLVDAASLSSLMYVVGGPKSVALLLLPLFIIYHSIYLGYFSGLLSATFFSLFYVSFAYVWDEIEFMTSYIAVQVPFFYLLAIFGGHLAERRLNEQLRRDELSPPPRRDQIEATPAPYDDAATEGLDCGAILQEITTACSQLTGLPKCLLALVDEGSANLVGRAGNIDPQQINLASIDQLVFGFEERSATAQAMRTGKPVVVTNAIGEKHKMPSWAPWFGAAVMLVVPLVTGDRNWGAMYLFDRKPGRTIATEKVYLAKGYAKLAAEALANAETRRPSVRRRP